MKKLILVIVMIYCVEILDAATINIPADYSTIQAGINAAIAGDVVLVQPGIYVENINYNGKNITVGSLFYTTLDTSYISQTIIDGDSIDSVVKFESGEDSNAVLSGFTLINGYATGYDLYNDGGGVQCMNSSPRIGHLIIKNCYASDNGAGIYMQDCSPQLNNILLFDNHGKDGGALYFQESNAVLNRIVAVYNTSEVIGGAIGSGEYSQPIINNSTFANNYCDLYGGGVYSSSYAIPIFVNCIFWNNHPEEFYFSYGGSIDITYSDIEGGWTGIGNIDSDPAFVDSSNYNFQLTLNSPCIDAGDPSSPPDPDGTISDMGGYYYNQSHILSLPIDVAGAPSCNVSIPLDYNNINSTGIEVIEVTISYDNSILWGTGATLTGTVIENEDYGIQYNTVSDSLLNIWIYSNSNLYTGGGIVAYIEFDVDINAVIGNTSELEFIFAEVNENPASTEDGLFTVIESYSISGNTLYYYDQSSISNAIIQLEQSKYEAISDTTGYYEILNIPTGNYISSSSKNDELGGLSSLDASRIARYGVGLYSLTDHEIIAADVSLNSSVSPLDASRVARYGVGLIDSLNDENINWVFVADSVDSTNWPPINYETFKYYTPLNANMIDEDFVGVRLGDVTGNWAPLKKKLIAGTKDISATLPEVTGAPTDTVTVPLDVFGLENLEGMDITITFNEQVIDALGATLNGGILENENFGYQVNTNVDNEIVLWIYALGDPYSGSGTVALIDFEVVGVVDDSTDIAFTQFDVNEIDYLENTEDGSLIVIPCSINGSEIPKEIFLGQNYPNPVKSNSEIYFGLNRKSDVEISIYNLKGQLVEKVIQGSFDPGYHSVNFSVENLPNGIYFYKMNVDGVDKEIIKMIILK